MSVHVISLNKGAEIAAKVREAGYGATKLPAIGQTGPVWQISIVVPRKQKLEVLTLINAVDPTAFVTVDDVRRVDGGYGRLAK
ncbi:MAG: DUF2179 domain-containing protein [Anaerolineales bacterium]|nr:DUF2179 domain-containing protein [Anaerolineales bacterium]